MKIFVVHARYESYGFAAFASLDKAKADVVTKSGFAGTGTLITWTYNEPESDCPAQHSLDQGQWDIEELEVTT